MKARLFSLLSMTLLIALLFSAAPALAQGQWEGWDVVIEDDNGWYFKFNKIYTFNQITSYSGQMTYANNNGPICAGQASATWDFPAQILSIMALDSCEQNYIFYNLVRPSGTMRLEGYYHWIYGPDVEIGAEVIHGYLEWHEGNGY